MLKDVILHIKPYPSAHYDEGLPDKIQEQSTQQGHGQNQHGIEHNTPGKTAKSRPALKCRTWTGIPECY